MNSGNSTTRRSLVQCAALLAASTAAPLLASATPSAAASGEIKTPPHERGSYRFKIGDFQATVVSDGYGDGAFWPAFANNAPEAEVKAALAANFIPPVRQGTCNILVVDTGKERIVVDTGFGWRRAPTYGNLEDNMRRAGIPPESVDFVIITHGHIDHLGGITNKAGGLVFPNAQYVLDEKEWAYWTGDQFERDTNSQPMAPAFKEGTILAAKTNLPPIKERLKLLKAEGEVVHGVRLVSAHGHSPAQAAVMFELGNQQLLHLADVVHDPMHLLYPAWTTVFDYDSAASTKNRRQILERVTVDRTLVMGYHMPFPSIGRVVRSGDAYRWEAARWNW